MPRKTSHKSAKTVQSAALTQFKKFKADHPDFVLFFRIGDFYELFHDDAQLAHQVLGVTLTSRAGVPMAGVPHHTVESYLRKMIAAGHRVAMCEQQGDGSALAPVETPAPTATPTATPRRHKWTPEQVAFLSDPDIAWADDTDWIEDFRDAFGDAVEHLTDTALRGKRQHLRRPDLKAQQIERARDRRQSAKQAA